MVDESYLVPGSYKFWLKFIATKENEIINITVTHPNKKLCEDVANSINKLKVIEPAINNGKKVDFLASFPVTITID
ncbi:hypothetical protein [Flavobacterium foetidum]|uniref:hypothetical protein n=1 Tax=Flavobacterium foetidum TaxID=2026681 RepID=UPI00107576BF|nr:hypothetical protein [Flavobacterium foetidum]KAF2513879.1 hypothetical protein E0W73_13710 [Flavobacterium foetidum]